mmetsp:Transcript_4939/g.7219  ORF Transcript_4939/g.7219 Transcript_4939/m.7219 type:complete len:399 (+) Transcript_4939:168-1364(+)
MHGSMAIFLANVVDVNQVRYKSRLTIKEKMDDGSIIQAIPGIFRASYLGPAVSDQTALSVQQQPSEKNLPQSIELVARQSNNSDKLFAGHNIFIIATVVSLSAIVGLFAFARHMHRTTHITENTIELNDEDMKSSKHSSHSSKTPTTSIHIDANTTDETLDDSQEAWLMSQQRSKELSVILEMENEDASFASFGRRSVALSSIGFQSSELSDDDDSSYFSHVLASSMSSLDSISETLVDNPSFNANAAAILLARRREENGHQPQSASSGCVPSPANSAVPTTLPHTLNPYQREPLPPEDSQSQPGAQALPPLNTSCHALIRASSPMTLSSRSSQESVLSPNTVPSTPTEHLSPASGETAPSLHSNQSSSMDSYPISPLSSNSATIRQVPEECELPKFT